MAKPVKRKVSGSKATSGGRVTPKGGPSGASKPGSAKNPARTPGSPGSSGALKSSTAARTTASAGAAPSSRYTPRSPSEYRVSPTWVPVLMFIFLIAGALVIIVNYTGAAWGTNNWYLIGGLTSILAGILVATQWH